MTNEFQRDEIPDDQPGWPKDRPHKPIDLVPSRRELDGFSRNLGRMTDAWLRDYLADPTWIAPEYTAAVEAEIKRRKPA